MWLLASFTQTAMLLAGVALMLLVLFRRIYRHYGRRPFSCGTAKVGKTAADQPDDPTRKDEQRGLSDAPPDILRWHVEMHETARELKAELDSKMRVLQLLTTQARQEADRLEQLLQRLDTSNVSSSEPVHENQPAETSSTSNPPPCSGDRETRILELADRGYASGEIAHRASVPLEIVERILKKRNGE